MTILLRTLLALSVLGISALLLVGCGGAEDEPAAPPQTAAESQPAPEPEPEPAPASEPEPAVPGPEPAPPQETVTGTAATEDAVTVGEDGMARVTIGATDQMQYTVNAFTVEAGQEVELTLVHEGQLAVEVMGHNVVILPAGEDYIAFGQQVTSAGGSPENEYLPESLRDGLIAFTRLIGGGESDTVRFTAPDTPGEYPFVCTFPGHFGLMNGVMTVR